MAYRHPDIGLGHPKRKDAPQCRLVGHYFYCLSSRKDKKLQTVIWDGQKFHTVHFGDPKYQHFHDKTGLLDPNLNHGNEKQRESYLARSAEIRDQEGRQTHKNPLSANFHARRVLW